MQKMFTEIYQKEKNECTAFILMLGAISEQLNEIISLLKISNQKEDKENNND